MSDAVIEQVPVAELPRAWREKLTASMGATVTVRPEAHACETAVNVADNPLFGIWRDREDMADLAGDTGSIRADRL